MTDQSSRVRTAERGTVTAEAAIVLPIIAFFALTVMWLVSVGVAKVATVDAARDAARAIARGEQPELAVEAARRTAPDGAVVDIAPERFGTVTVTVSVVAEAPGWLLVPLPAITVGSRATTLVEGEVHAAR